MDDIVFCPVCHATNAAADADCAHCSAALRILDRFVLTQAPPPSGGEDTVDAAGPLVSAKDLQTGRRVEVRLAEGSQRARLEREETVLRGLPGTLSSSVPAVLGSGNVSALVSALVLSASPFPTLGAQLDRGLRIDDGRARTLLRSLLTALARMQALSPPVGHRNLHPDAVGWDGANRVFLRDFARATDTVRDAETDLVVARPGYGPEGSVPPAQADLYGVAATLVHVLARRPPHELPRQRDGTPDVRPAIVVGEDLEALLERMLRPQHRDALPDAEAALAALRATPKRPVAIETRRGLWAGLVAVVVIGAVGVLTALTLRAPPPGPVLSAAPPPTEAPPPAPPPRASTDVVPPKPPPPPAPPPAAAPPAKTPRRSPPVAKPTGPTPASRLEAALRKRSSALEACADPAVDRLRFLITVAPDGKVDEVEAVGRTRGAAAPCVRKILEQLSLPKLGTRARVEAWLWLHPKLVVNTY